MVRTDFMLLFFAALIGLFAGSVLYAVGFGGLGFGALPVASGGDKVMYLYPARCVDCGKQSPPTCGECITYYSDAGVLDAISRDVGVELDPYVSTYVNEPTLLIAKDGRVSLGDARTKLSIAGNLCTIYGSRKSCKVIEGRLFSVQKCFSSHNVTVDTLVYQYSGDCPHCVKVSQALDELLQLDYMGRKYKAVSINTGVEAELNVLKQCAGDIVNTRYVPNVFCPANGRVKNGEIGFAELRDFADECMDASGK